MPKAMLPALVEPQDEAGDTLMILAPGPAVVMELAEPGTFLKPGSRIGVVEILRRRYVLVLPEGTRGTIVESFVAQEETPVEYRHPLVKLGRGLDQTQGVAGDGPSESGASQVASGIRICSPSHGIFYRRPDPDSPPYVEDGAVIEQGTVLGLVEVMKCFNQIRFEGPAYPARVKILTIHAEDGAEVESGQTLFVLESA